MKPRYKNLSILITMSNRQKALQNSLRNIITNMENKNKQAQNNQVLMNPNNVVLDKTKLS